ncbi:MULTISPECIES: hypothetical protein [unclassified Nocardia]|uniref:hypothetical protein n=1 Tax=unclassified Nocardia TaxID=2637762 RepID=UPI001CE49FA0|nr:MULTISPECIES: hypothetical protein [unclassified Nocardia]
MGKDEEFEARISALEGEVAMLRRVEEEIPALRRETVEAVRNASAAQVLAQAADRDAADVRVVLRGQQRLLNALRETQVEQGQKIDGLLSRMGDLDARVDGLEHEMRAGFSMTHTGMAQITAMLTILMNREDEGQPNEAGAERAQGGDSAE